jgi:hypothetical protein
MSGTLQTDHVDCFQRERVADIHSRMSAIAPLPALCANPFCRQTTSVGRWCFACREAYRTGFRWGALTVVVVAGLTAVSVVLAFWFLL